MMCALSRRSTMIIQLVVFSGVIWGSLAATTTTGMPETPMDSMETTTTMATDTSTHGASTVVTNSPTSGVSTGVTNSPTQGVSTGATNSPTSGVSTGATNSPTDGSTQGSMETTTNGTERLCMALPVLVAIIATVHQLSNNYI